jgi:tetratricopeptide (TPR) repeat protein
VLGEKQKALLTLNRALALSRAIGARESEAGSLFQLGKIYFLFDEKQKALGFLNQALPVFQELKNRSMEAETLYTLSLIYDALGSKRKGLELYHQYLELKAREEEKPLPGTGQG